MRRCRSILQQSAAEKLSRLLPRHLPSGTTRLPASALGSAVISEFEKLTAEQVEGVVACIDPVNGWYEVNKSSIGASHDAENEISLVLLPGPLERWSRDPTQLVSVLRASLRQGKRGALLQAPPSAASSRDVLHITRSSGASLSSYLRAASTAAASGHTLVAVCCWNSKLEGAHGLEAPALEQQHPHAFHSYSFDLERVRDQTEQRNFEPHLCHVVIPLPHAPSMSQPMPRVLTDGLAAFYSRQDLQRTEVSRIEGALPRSKHRDLESAHVAYLRLQAVVGEYLCTERGIHAPYPFPATLLHHEMQWGLVECQLGSILQAIPESQMLRFGDNLLLPLHNAFFQSTMMPMLRMFAEQHNSYRDRTRRHKHTQKSVTQQAAEIPIVKFFTWTWERVLEMSAPADSAMRSDAITPSDETRHLWRLYFEKIGPLSAYEGYLARWFTYFPHAVQLRNEKGLMHVCFWKNV
ncbi:Hypothetical protein, putative [Bodo saltans]|uniref:Uncharacterized protein n=1 Tax=Bodo saltans TaxID=75058 RepID=A0A0S4IWV2_BODSA|nr:Hypothetical protein, putative [Bodo saltans]|eukprot:CUG06452.1 Hypothetical protein, putative [Bodo saltans]